MRVVVQRVKKANCVVEGKIVGSINKGYMLLVGFNNQDTIANVIKMAEKINNLRIFDDDNGKINLNIHDVKGEILSISQFTLYASLVKCNRPSFTDSMKADDARLLYEEFNKILVDKFNLLVIPGVFQANMELNLTCDGPVTITLEY